MELNEFHLVIEANKESFSYMDRFFMLPHILSANKIKALIFNIDSEAPEWSLYETDELSEIKLFDSIIPIDNLKVTRNDVVYSAVILFHEKLPKKDFYLQKFIKFLFKLGNNNNIE